MLVRFTVCTYDGMYRVGQKKPDCFFGPPCTIDWSSAEVSC